MSGRKNEYLAGESLNPLYLIFWCHIEVYWSVLLCRDFP